MWILPTTIHSLHKFIIIITTCSLTLCRTPKFFFCWTIKSIFRLLISNEKKFQVMIVFLVGFIFIILSSVTKLNTRKRSLWNNKMNIWVFVSTEAITNKRKIQTNIFQWNKHKIFYGFPLSSRATHTWIFFFDDHKNSNK